MGSCHRFDLLGGYPCLPNRRPRLRSASSLVAPHTTALYHRAILSAFSLRVAIATLSHSLLAPLPSIVNAVNAALWSHFCTAGMPPAVYAHSIMPFVLRLLHIPRLSRSSSYRPPRWPRARFTVALPRARPTPRPRVPRDLNMGAFLQKAVSTQVSIGLQNSPYLSISGTINNRTCEPRMYTRSRCVTRPSRWVTLMFSICTFMLSSAVAMGQYLIQN